MQEIPMPQVLDPDRVPGDKREEITVDFHRARAENLQVALGKSCEYAKQLWRDLDAARAYTWWPACRRSRWATYRR